MKSLRYIIFGQSEHNIIESGLCVNGRLRWSLKIIFNTVNLFINIFQSLNLKKLCVHCIHHFLMTAYSQFEHEHWGPQKHVFFEFSKHKKIIKQKTN